VAYEPNYPQAPFDAVMPATAQTATLWIAVTVLALCGLIAIWQSVKKRSMLPVLYLVGGFVAILLEPLVTHFGHAIHPPVGQISLFTTADRAIPWHIALIYAFYFGGVFMFMNDRIRRGAFTQAYVWKSYFFVCGLAYLIEIVPVHIGLWVYYPPQALWVWKGGMPLFWTFVNAACIFMPLTLIKLAYPLLHGARQILVVPLIAMGAQMGHFGCGFVLYNVANSAAPAWLVEVAGLLSVAMAFGLVFLCARLLSGDTVALMAGSRGVSVTPTTSNSVGGIWKGGPLRSS
jgi:hypothetical protein